MNIELIQIENPMSYNLILGQSHFIKTVEDLYEIVATNVPGAKFGVAFNEASGPCLTRFSGTDPELIDLAVDNIQRIGAGHLFLIFMKDFFPIHVLNAIKFCPEVVSIFCATANPLKVVALRDEDGAGVLGVIDGFSPKGIEDTEAIQLRKDFLRKIGYKQ